MKKDNLIRLLSVSVCIVLIAAMALFTSGCGETPDSEVSESPVSSSVETKKLGTGKTQFEFSVVDIEGKKEKFVILTDKKTVGDALIEVDLIKGEQQGAGYMVNYVNGIRADYEKDGMYWAFYIDDAYAMTGAKETDIESGKTYSFKMEKG